MKAPYGSCSHDTIPEPRLHHGDTRADGFRFYVYQKWNGRIYEKWMSPQAWERHIAENRRRDREYRARMAIERKRAPEERLSPTIAANGQLVFASCDW